MDANARNFIEDDNGIKHRHPGEPHRLVCHAIWVQPLHDVQALKDAQALSELDDDDAVANVCKAVGKDLGASVAKLAATKFKLVASRSDISTGPRERSGGPRDHL